MAIKLKPEVEEQLIGSLRRYWKQEEDAELGELRAKLFLKYIVDEVGPCIYNQAIRDAQEYMQEKTMDMEISCYAEEFNYWASRKKKPRS
ncbi:uncharacterized protein (DUF2164 family) [Advenella incenata]|jgi:uncharacterized protein (DUF2164 family)|uniref:Uncharacterized protein (DUF2164 family) n=1 Tax=Advenella incenata TaxID=267800 RepID=A0A4Q7VPV3_9BURK|nr:DUF2164 domain-containing protein [Advenella incenata]RZT98460.1 uncharacterized protein (DUF2164 family) [Advenella incenata]